MLTIITDYIITFTGLAKRVRARMLLASTSEIYGNPSVSFFTTVNAEDFGLINCLITGTSPERELLGKCQSDWPKGMLWWRKTCCGDNGLQLCQTGIYIVGVVMWSLWVWSCDPCSLSYALWRSGLYLYYCQDNVEVRVARIFNTYGPRMHMYDGKL